MTPMNMSNSEIQDQLVMTRAGLLCAKKAGNQKLVRHAWTVMDQLLDEINNRKHEEVTHA